jgi:very-short-patch-repair endonuclease
MRRSRTSLPQGPGRPRTRLAQLARRSFTPAEKLLDKALRGAGFGGRYQREWVLERKWRLDFFFYEARLGIEVDGGYHQTPEQIVKDNHKALACHRADVTLLRFSNEEVLGDIKGVMVAISTAYHRLKR